MADTNAGLAAELDALTASLRAITVQVRAQSRSGSMGSGVIWRPDGLVVTNAHVAHGPRAIVELSDGRVHHARVVARDRQQDLAALSIDGDTFPAARLSDPRRLRAGELLVALGFPWGLADALALGIVHGLARDDDGDVQWVVADLRLAPGNSGGPLADALGRVVGINTMIVRGLGVAVPAGRVVRFLGEALARAA